MPKETGRITGQKLHDCDICGFTYRFSETGLNTAGLRVCFEKCFDIGKFVYPFVVVSTTVVSVSGFLTAEDGTYILTEDGQKIQL